MSDTVAAGLLEGVGVGEQELTDPREGEHDGVLEDVQVVANNPGARVPHALVITYGGMRDEEGQEFSFDDRIGLPSSESDKQMLGIFNGTLKSFGFIEKGDQKPYFADTDEQREAFANAFRKLIGTKVPLKLTTKDGWLRARIRRT